MPKSTREEAGLMESYWQDIQHFQPLERSAEARLVRQAREGDNEAHRQLVTANLRFVVSVAKEFSGGNLSMIELVAEGNVGLLEAARRFDEQRGHKFITYAIWWIRQSMYRALAEQKRVVRPPVNQKHDLRKVEQQNGLLAQQLGRTPTLDEIASGAGISRARTIKALQSGQRDFYFDAPLYADEDETLLGYFETDEALPEEIYEEVDLCSKLTRCLNNLENREAQIVRWYFGLGGQEPMTLEKIGEAFGVTRERVRQIRDRALEKLRNQYGEILGDFSIN
ncbi:MAG: sigma-70 family RNA polymerase sigma factor [Candidatus Latescibacteria bacterium]|nr:sigma-70 family RNA polymerase sigma factor [Candidatus Latescibacterota bacterium]